MQSLFGSMLIGGDSGLLLFDFARKVCLLLLARFEWQIGCTL